MSFLLQRRPVYINFFARPERSLYSARFHVCTRATVVKIYGNETAVTDLGNSKASVFVWKQVSTLVFGRFIKMVFAGGQVMKYPYTVTGKLAHFPYRWHWKNGRFVRFLGFTLLAVFPLIVKIHSAVHAPGNVRQWEEIRKKREHTHFDPAH